MKYLNVLALGALSFLLLAAPSKAQAQYQNGYYGQQNWRAAMSSDDQRQFDEDYAKWVDSQRKNDQDDVSKYAGKMQQIMSRDNIPSNVPFDLIASNPANGYPQYGAYPAYPNGAYAANAPVRLSADDQRKFDDEYAKWMDSQRKNDQDDVAKHAGKMEEIMSRYNIPSNVPFGAIAANGYAAAPAPYPYAYGQPAPQRLSAKDQNDFDKAYRHWMDARRKKDMDDVDKNARKMEEIMARYNIPANVPFDQIVSPAGMYH